jgi:hypothetical protein
LILIAGFYALWFNGISHTSSFSGILCTTRNKDLDRWAQGHCLGSIEHDIGKQKLQYGLLSPDNNSTEKLDSDVGHAAFGIPGTITKLKKGDNCA